MPKEKLFGTAAHLGVINAPAPCRVGQIHPASFALTGAHPLPDGRPAEGRSISVRPRKWEDVTMPTTMDYQKTMQALKRLRVETGSLACFGCGHEHNCSTQGCAILRNAVGHMEVALANYDHLSALTKQQAEDIQALEHATLTPPNEPMTQADLDSMDYDKVWIDYGDDGEWALVVNGRIYCLAVLEGAGFEDILRDEVGGETMDRPSGDYTVYRRPPEGEEDNNGT